MTCILQPNFNKFCRNYLITVLLLVRLSVYPLEETIAFLSGEKRVANPLILRWRKSTFNNVTIILRTAVCNTFHWIFCDQRSQGPKLQCLGFPVSNSELKYRQNASFSGLNIIFSISKIQSHAKNNKILLKI